MANCEKCGKTVTVPETIELCKQCKASLALEGEKYVQAFIPICAECYARFIELFEDHKGKRKKDVKHI